ncbi:hypothetical protein I79_005765 [Cricetulus griseus]|uniref:Uncharacterized protein n=1 Tax=Cricetulus griseus TaxID=10029 RepID=G3H612_CRIGR|nr:hypothetical protein I79_005765 [Cricetulus griseus]
MEFWKAQGTIGSVLLLSQLQKILCESTGRKAECYKVKSQRLIHPSRRSQLPTAGYLRATV